MMVMPNIILTMPNTNDKENSPIRTQDETKKMTERIQRADSTEGSLANSALSHTSWQKIKYSFQNLKTKIRFRVQI